MFENVENTLSYHETGILKQEYRFCSICIQSNTGRIWCQCNTKRLRKDFNKWTSGNEFIDMFIQNVQLKARNNLVVMEWIPYNRLRNIQYLAQGGFSIIYKAIWLDGFIDKWDGENQQWKRYFLKSFSDEDYENAKQENIKSPLNKNEKTGWHVVLKSLNNSSNIDENFLNEWRNYLYFMYSSVDINSASIRLYGITQDPETSYNGLYETRGNLLSFDHYTVFISDFGSSKPADKPTKSNEIYGVLPYIAPEVLRGKPYTKAADIYSFGIIMWEMISGVPAFNNVSHDF